jgi:hypothetical protein
MYRSLFAISDATRGGLVRRPSTEVGNAKARRRSQAGKHSPFPAHQCGIRRAARLQSGSSVNLHVPSTLMDNGKPPEQALCHSGKARNSSIFNWLITERSYP